MKPSTYQATEQVMIGAPAQLDVPHMLDDDLFGHFRRAVEHDALFAEAPQILERVQKVNGHCYVGDALHHLHTECFISGLQLLIDLLQP